MRCGGMRQLAVTLARASGVTRGRSAATTSAPASASAMPTTPAPCSQFQSTERGRASAPESSAVVSVPAHSATSPPGAQKDQVVKGRAVTPPCAHQQQRNAHHACHSCLSLTRGVGELLRPQVPAHQPQRLPFQDGFSGALTQTCGQVSAPASASAMPPQHLHHQKKWVLVYASYPDTCQRPVTVAATSAFTWRKGACQPSSHNLRARQRQRGPRTFAHESPDGAHSKLEA